MGQSVSLASRRFDVRIQAATDLVKTGSDSSIAKRLALGVSVTEEHYKWVSRVTVGVTR